MQTSLKLRSWCRFAFGHYYQPTDHTNRLNKTAIIISIYVLFLKNNFIYLFIFDSIGSSLLCGLLVAVSGSYSLVAGHRLVTAVASLIEGHRFQNMGSIAVAQGLRCSVASGIFLDQGSDSCLLHWQVDSLLLSHQGSPNIYLSNIHLSNEIHLINTHEDKGDIYL